jgi:hypothetical protein
VEGGMKDRGQKNIRKSWRSNGAVRRAENQRRKGRHPSRGMTSDGYDPVLEIVIASAAKQSSFLPRRAMDCFASLAMTARHGFAFSPHVSREV